MKLYQWKGVIDGVNCFVYAHAENLEAAQELAFKVTPNEMKDKVFGIVNNSEPVVHNSTVVIVRADSRLL